jgi:16S rRNA U516 pseudouridylate synthase RsuA-like enzyme
MGICSRRTAEQIIQQGMVKVDGKIVDSNVGVSNENLI